MDNNTVVIESQVDWLTASAHTPDRRERLRLVAETAAIRTERGDNQTRAWSLMGFRGWRVGRVRFGERDGAGLVQFSGQLAEDWLHDVLAASDTQTRIDIAVTARFQPVSSTHSLEAYTAAEAYYAVHPEAGLPSLVMDADGGQTAYIGHRSSDWFLRLYNKWAECVAAHRPLEAQHYQGCYRYELECKGQIAPRVALTMDAPGDRGEAIRSLVVNYCLSHGVTPAFHSLTPVRLLGGFSRRSDDDSKIDWLRRQVGPSVRSLLQRRNRAEVLEALGLLDPENGGPDRTDVP